MPEKEFSGRVALVTGAGSSIGEATARALAAAGADLAIVGRKREPLLALADKIPVESRAVVIQADLATSDGARKTIAETIAAYGRLDILVNAAGILSSGSIETTTMEAWDALMNINLRSVFELMHLAVPHLIATRGQIINVSSVTGLRSFPGVLAYCVSKAALDQLTRCAALELAEKGVRVNAVNPGVVVTGLHRSSGMDEQAYQAFLDRSRTTHPLGRVGRPEEIADLIVFLAKAEWITGATYAIDGGRGLTCAR